jgi:predicted nucleotidyltransferase
MLTNDIGLDTKTLRKIEQIFAKYLVIEQVKLYGSRAKGTFHPHSDIDLVAIGHDLNRFIISNILIDLDDSDIPYLIDLQNYHELKNRQLIDHIDRVGLIIYQKQ